MQANLPNKTTFIPTLPINEHQIFRAMRTYPDNVKVYHPRGRIDATSVFWLNKFQPNALNFAAFIDPKAAEPLALAKRILADINKLAWKFDVDRIITSDYAPQHAFNKWLPTQGFKRVEKATEPQLRLSEVQLEAPSTAITTRLLTSAELVNNQALWNEVATTAFMHYRSAHQSNPVGDISLSTWQALLVAKLVMQAPAVLLDDQGSLASYCLIYQPTAGEVTLDHFGETQPGNLLSLTAAQFFWLESRFQTITLNLSATDKLGLQIYRNFPFNKNAVYESYLKITQY